MGWLREHGILESRVKKIAPKRVPELLKRLRTRLEKMPEGRRKKWLQAKVKDWEMKPPDEVLREIIIALIVVFGLALVGSIIGVAVAKRE